MQQAQPLSPALARRILQHFGLPQDPPADLETLTRLLNAYTRQVPWESASRIVRRARSQTSAECAFFADAFWEGALRIGTGGTCYESNYAFFSLLKRLGYAGYLTINNMGALIGCHSAIIVRLDGKKYLADVGLPLHVVIPLPSPQAEQAEANSPFFRYGIEREAANRYAVWRHPHPRGKAFTLVDDPISDQVYRRITIRDYRHDGGQFLDAVVIQKVIENQLWRYNSDDSPLHLQQFVAGQRHNHALEGDVASQIAAKFGIDGAIVGEALDTLKS